MMLEVQAPLPWTIEGTLYQSEVVRQKKNCEEHSQFPGSQKKGRKRVRKPQKNYRRGPYIGRFHLIDWRNSREAPIRIGPKPSLPRGGRRRPPSGGGTGATAGRGGEPSAQWPIERVLEK